MKKLLLLSALALLPLLAPAGNSAAIFANVRYLSLNETVLDCPFDKDISYGLSYAYFDGAGYVEFGVNYAPEASYKTVTSTVDPTNPNKIETEISVLPVEDVDCVWTPFARLVFVDRFVALGVGIRDNYFVYSSESNRDSEWSDLLYELYLGLEIPVASLTLGGGAYYTFTDWGDAFSDFDSDFLEYGFHLGFKF